MAWHLANYSNPLFFKGEVWPWVQVDSFMNYKNSVNFTKKILKANMSIYVMAIHSYIFYFWILNIYSDIICWISKKFQLSFDPVTQILSIFFKIFSHVYKSWLNLVTVSRNFQNFNYLGKYKQKGIHLKGSSLKFHNFICSTNFHVVFFQWNA